MIFLFLVAAAVAVEHLAFRNAAWRRRELVRRAIGDSTVIGLAGVVMLLTGASATAWLTWAALLAGFVLAGAIKGALAWYDESRGKLLRGALNEQIEEATK